MQTFSAINLLRKFDSGRHAGISQTFLLFSGTHVGPPRRTVVDYVTLIPNAKSHRALQARILVKPLDLVGDLLAIQGPGDSLSAYRVGAVETRFEPGMPQLLLPDFRHVDPASLA